MNKFEIISLLPIFFLIFACNDMNDIQSRFAELEEQTYLGKVDSIKSYPGFGKAKITWYVGSDPKIDKTVIYWNMRNDSIVKDFVRTTPGVQKDSIIIENLPEGATLFAFRNISSRGETSLFSSASVTAWGPDFAERLSARKITSSEFDYEESIFKLGFSSTFTGDSVIYSKLLFTDTYGKERTVRIERNTSSVVLSDFPDGGEVRFQTVFFPPEGIDTVYNAFEIVKAPKVIFDMGEKVAFGGGSGSKYFDRDGTYLYEWNDEGDVIVYLVNADGSFTQTGTYHSLLPRNSCRDFFFYDDDKFIGVSTANALSMLRIVDGELFYVKTPSGAISFGSGFSMATFIPAKGFFYTLDKGSLRTWPVNNNATWGTPVGTTVGTGCSYEPLALFKHKILIGVDAEGYLWSVPISTTGYPGSKSKIGSGWNRFKQIVTVGNYVLGMDENGDLWKYVFDTEHYWVVNSAG